MRAITMTARLTGSGLAACLCASTLAAPVASISGERALREDCSEFSEAGMRDCLAKKAENSQTALALAEKKAASLISRWNEAPHYIEEAQAKLAASNRVFITYRNAQCAFSVSLAGGAIGSARESGRLACVAELNGRRAEQLQDAVSGLPSK